MSPPLASDADEAARAAIRDFAEDGGDPCALSPRESHVLQSALYPDLAALVNDVDVVLRAAPVEQTVEAPASHTLAGRVIATLQVQEVLAGSHQGKSIAVDYGQRVMHGNDALVRLSAIDLDLCLPGEVILFLKRTATPDVYAAGFQAWARIDASAISSAAGNHIFEAYASDDALSAAVRDVASEQLSQNVPRGFLLCDAMRSSEAYQDPIVCPGDTFNPYQAFRLDAPMSQASVLPTDPGPSPLSLGRIDLQPDGPELNALLTALDTTVVLQPAEPEPDDLIRISIVPVEPIGDRTKISLEYSPSQGIIRVQSSGGQFLATPAFQEAMQPFVPNP